MLLTGWGSVSRLNLEESVSLSNSPRDSPLQQADRTDGADWGNRRRSSEKKKLMKGNEREKQLVERGDDKRLRK